MAKYTVRLVREVSDTLDTIIEVEAADAEAAGVAALALANKPDAGLDWQVAYEGEPGTAEIDSVRDENGREAG